MAVRSRIFSQGEVIEDKYRVEGALARGGMSILYKATSLANGKVVAIKQPKPDADSKFELYCDSIRCEANMLSRLDHPQIVGYIDFIHNYDMLVMEYVDGFSLAELYECKKATAEDALNIAKKLADAIHYLHKMGVIHRDICPRNIILDSKKIPHIIDFGTVLDKKQETCLTSGVFHGPYTSPELSRSESNLAYPALEACDVYSFGATLYFVLSTSAPPILSEETPCLNLRGEHIFDRFIARTTQRDPFARISLPDAINELKEIEGIVRFKPILKVFKSNDPCIKDGALFFLDKSKNRIGTSNFFEVPFPEVRFITAVHAEISNVGNNWYVADCNSANGTFLNRNQVIPGERKLLNDGDMIWLVYNPSKPKEPYIQLEFIKDKKRIEQYYDELDNLDIQTSWDWEGKEIHMRTRVKNDSRLPWKHVKVDYSGMDECFKCEKLKVFNFHLEPEHERFYENKMELVDDSIGGDFVYPVKVSIGGRLIREDNIHIRYGESFRPSTGLKVEHAKRIEEGKINLNMKLHNTSPYTYTRVSVSPNIPDGLELVIQENFQKAIPSIGSNEEHLITYQLKPKRKVKATIHFDVSYLDHMGKKQQVNVKGIETGEIMPLIEPLEMSQKDFIAETKRLAPASRRTMYKDISLSKASKRISKVCESLFPVLEFKEKDSLQLFYSGRPTEGGQRPFLLLCGAWTKEDGTVELNVDAYSPDQDEAEEFLQDHFESIDRAFRMEKAILVTQVTNVVNIRDSVIYKSNVGEKGKTQMNLEEGGLAYKTGQ